MINGASIKELRKGEKLTQEELGDYLGTTGNVVSRWERGIAQPNQDNLVKLSERFNKPTDYFLKGGNSEIKERSVTENKGMLIFELDSKRLEVPATSEFSEQFWKRVDKMIEMSIHE